MWDRFNSDPCHNRKDSSTCHDTTTDLSVARHLNCGLVGGSVARGANRCHRIGGEWPILVGEGAG
jgi:hypothetical protein